MVGTSSSGDRVGDRVPELGHRAGLPLVDAGVAPKGQGQHVLIIDSNLLTAQAVAAALTQLDLDARSTPAARTAVPDDHLAWRPQVALLDIDSVSSVAALACIRSLRADGVPTAVVTSNLDAPLAGEAVHAGAVSVVYKDAPLEQLVQVLLRILAGGEALTEPVKRRLLERRGRLAAFEVLTHREKFVLSQLMEGRSAEAIARESYVSISTVRSQIKAILQKLGVNSQLAAASLARQVGWGYATPPEPAHESRAPLRTPCT